MVAIVPILIVALALIGAGAVVLGLRGRRVDDHPLCRKCGFDVVGVVEHHGGERAVCPECGADLTGARALRRGNRKKRPRVIATGAAALVIAAVLGAAIGVGAATNFNWNTIKPAILLTVEAQSGDRDTAETALDELLKRAQDNSLAADRLDQLAEIGLDRQTDLNLEWLPQWGSLIELAWQRGRLSDEQVERYAKQAMVMFPMQATDPRAPAEMRVSQDPLYADEPVTPRIGVVGRTDRSPLVEIRARLERLAINGEEIPIRNDRLTVTPATGGAGSAGFTEPVPLDAGRHTIEARLRFTAFRTDGGRSGLSIRVPSEGARPEPSGEPAARWSRTIEATIDVRPARPAHEVELVADEALRERVRQALDVKVEAERIEEGVKCWLQLGVDDPPIALSFETSLRWRAGEDEERRRRFSTFHLKPGANRAMRTVDSFDAFEADAVDVVLSPDPDRVERLDGYSRIFGEEIVFEDVRVQWKDEVGARED